MGQGKLYILPNHLDLDSTSLEIFPQKLPKIVVQLDALICESEKGARRYLKCFHFEEGKTFRDVPLYVLNEHSEKEEIQSLADKIASGGIYGLISDCGMPCFADPGSHLITLLQDKQIDLEILSGPSSIFQALILSGFSAQNFTFHGYLPRKEGELVKKFKEMGLSAHQDKQTQVFIEAPYRNTKLFEQMLKTLHPNIKVCVAIDLMTKKETIISGKVLDLKKKAPHLPKAPAVFLLSS